MKKSVAYLFPLMDKEQLESKNKAVKDKVLLATVKGDVHDIGKNIVGVVLSCSNYTVLDLGVMVPASTIIETAKREKVNYIGLSGLITPSLDEMVFVAKKMREENLQISLLIGGATTSKAHTAIKIFPEYNYPVIHVEDASLVTNVLNSLRNQNTNNYWNNLQKDYKEIQEKYKSKQSQKSFFTIQEARKMAFYKINTDYIWKEKNIYIPHFLGEKVFHSLPLELISSFIDWTPFFITWDMHGRFPTILKDEKIGKQATEIYNEAQTLLKKIIQKKQFVIKGVIAFYPANSIEDDDIEIYSTGKQKKVLERFYFLRQQYVKEKDTTQYCLSDFIAPKSSGITDYIGLFATTVHNVTEVAKVYEDQNDDYNAIMTKALGDRLAEAAAEYLHKFARKSWGYGKTENLALEEIIREKYQGIRPAIGYPACPDHTEKEKIFCLLNINNNIQMNLTENFSMYPPSSVSGLYFSHPKSRYFTIGKIQKDQVKSYAKRKNITVEDAEKWLSTHLSY